MYPVLRERSHSYADFFADTEAFLLKNARAKLCLQASPLGGNLLLENCNPDSDFQDWSWQGHSLMNRGTRSCLSVVGDDTVQTSLCGSTSWDCSDSLLSPLGSSQGYLVANRKGVTLSTVRALKAKWQNVADRSVCEEKAGKCHPGTSGTHTRCWGMQKGAISVLGSFHPWLPHHNGICGGSQALSTSQCCALPHGCLLPARKAVLGSAGSQGDGHS